MEGRYKDYTQNEDEYMNKIMPDFYHLPDFEQMPVS